ncbi:hypothetical protein CN374_29090 [Bacillus cereus]|nr:hypothetical protein CN374_29090 [Bacillus cereus]
MISVYRNGVLDNKWNLTTSGSGPITGKAFTDMKVIDFDEKAEYTVTYVLRDKYKNTVNQVDTKATYNQSVRSTIDDMNVRQSDNTTMISIHLALLVDILARLKAEEVKK